jgi:hypothetical protein
VLTDGAGPNQRSRFARDDSWNVFGTLPGVASNWVGLEGAEWAPYAGTVDDGPGLIRFMFETRAEPTCRASRFSG